MKPGLPAPYSIGLQYTLESLYAAKCAAESGCVESGGVPRLGSAAERVNPGSGRFEQGSFDVYNLNVTISNEFKIISKVK